MKVTAVLLAAGLALNSFPGLINSPEIKSAHKRGSVLSVMASPLQDVTSLINSANPLNERVNRPAKEKYDDGGICFAIAGASPVQSWSRLMGAVASVIPQSSSGCSVRKDAPPGFPHIPFFLLFLIILSLSNIPGAVKIFLSGRTRLAAMSRVFLFVRGKAMNGALYEPA